MNRRPLIAGIIALSLAGVASAQSSAGHSYVPPVGFVPDSETATKIAEAVWVPIYGAQQIASERPFIAVLKNDVWLVMGSLPTEEPGYDALGGVAEIEIAKKDGRILRVSHGK